MQIIDKKIRAKARKMAQQSIYNSVKYLGKWKDYDVFEPTFNDDEIHFIGFPQFILYNEKGYRWTNNNEESSAIMAALWK